MNTEVTFELGEHRDTNVIYILFDYNQKLIERVKKLVGVKWSQSKKCWYVIDNKEYREKFGIKQKELTHGQEQNISLENQLALKRYRDTLILKGYSPKTLQT
jgi:integrase/recombinase XerD